MKCIRTLVAALLVLMALAAPARADLIITGASTTVGANSTGSVDFYVSGTNVAGDALAYISLQLQITTVSGSSTLQFTTSQPDPYSNSNYVFFGNSGFQDNSLPFYNAPSTTVTFNDTIAGGDFNDGNTGPGYTSITPTSNYLLASVQFQTPLGASPGDTFQISLVTSQTSFQDNNSNNIGYSSTPATVQVTLSSVPEPSSLILAGLGSMAGLMCYWRSRSLARRASEGALAVATTQTP